MPASKVFIARHGERIDHVDKSWRSTAPRSHDPFLTDKGIAQAAALGKHLATKDISLIFASPFYRTVQTAHQVALATSAPIYVEPGICEFLHPDWFSTTPEFLPPEALKAEFPSINAAYVPAVKPEYPETREQLIERAQRTAKLLAARYDGNILLVGHGITCEFTARGLTGTGPRPYIAYCALQTCARIDKAGELYHVEGADEVDVSFIPDDIRPYVKTGYR